MSAVGFGAVWQIFMFLCIDDSLGISLAHTFVTTNVINFVIKILGAGTGGTICISMLEAMGLNHHH